VKVYLGGIVYDYFKAGHMNSMLRLNSLAQQSGVKTWNEVHRGDALVSRARSRTASRFLRSDCDVMLSIDSDIEFEPQDALSICYEALNKRAPVGGLYMTRALETQPAVLLPDEVVAAPGTRPVEVPFLSTGFMAIPKEVFQALSEDLPLCHQTWIDSAGRDLSFWPFYMPFVIEWPEDGHMYLSEDWAFCQRAKEAGYKLWLDAGVNLKHWGEYAYTKEDLVRPPKLGPTPLKLGRSEDGSLHVEVLDAPD
jgi:hypothetical protein